MADFLREKYGYEDELFEKDVDVNFHCPICQNVLKDPRMCQNNEHIFCHDCITKHLRINSERCPHCLERLTVETLRPAPRVVNNYLSELKIKCDFADRGCQEFVRLEELPSHVKNCGFAPVKCSNEECQMVIDKRDRTRHENVVCGFGTVKKEVKAIKAHMDVRMEGVEYQVKVLKEDVQGIKDNLAQVKHEVVKLSLTLSEVLSKLRSLEQNNHEASSAGIIAWSSTSSPGSIPTLVGTSSTGTTSSAANFFWSGDTSSTRTTFSLGGTLSENSLFPQGSSSSASSTIPCTSSAGSLIPLGNTSSEDNPFSLGGVSPADNPFPLGSTSSALSPNPLSRTFSVGSPLPLNGSSSVSGNFPLSSTSSAVSSFSMQDEFSFPLCSALSGVSSSSSGSTSIAGRTLPLEDTSSACNPFLLGGISSEGNHFSSGDTLSAAGPLSLGDTSSAGSTFSLGGISLVLPRFGRATPR